MDTATSSGLEIMGVEWLGACYDILKADLLDLGHSAKPGRNVFRVARAKGGKDYKTYRSGAYSVPVGVKLRHAPSLDVQSTSDMISNSYEFREKITREFSVTGGFGDYFEFSASSSSQLTSERTGSHQEMVKYCILVRKFHNVMLDVHADPGSAEITELRRLLDPDFVAAVAKLPADDAGPGGQENPFRRFVEEYGTHFARQLTLGGMAWEQVRVKADAIGSNEVSEERIEAQASAGVEAFKVGTKASVATENARKQDAECKIERTQIKFVGGKGGLELVSAFVAEIDDDPVPIMPESEFLRLSDLLTPAFFPDDPAIERKAELLDDAIDEYLLSNGKWSNDCIYYSEPTVWTGIEEFVGGGPAPAVSYPLLITADAHLIGPANPLTNPQNLPSAQIVLEPAENPGLEGQIAYFGADYPVRLRVQDGKGTFRGYLNWTDKTFYGVSENHREVILSPTPDDTRSIWFIELYAPNRKLEYPRALVNGDRVSVYHVDPTDPGRRIHHLRLEPRTVGVPPGLPPGQPPGLLGRVHTEPARGDTPRQQVRALFGFTLRRA
ncbi:MAG: MACPF domain-containing protein [Acetobacteraceae bacterium]|jgi:hypothetical protein|nr:MACPF domain-containing protein [Acetobacteraceae bacterium]